MESIRSTNNNNVSYQNYERPGQFTKSNIQQQTSHQQKR